MKYHKLTDTHFTHTNRQKIDRRQQQTLSVFGFLKIMLLVIATSLLSAPQLYADTFKVKDTKSQAAVSRAHRILRERIIIKAKVVGPCAYAFSPKADNRLYQEKDIDDETDCGVKIIVKKVSRVKRHRAKTGRKFKRVVRKLKGFPVNFAGFNDRYYVGPQKVQIGWTNDRGAVQFNFDWETSFCHYMAWEPGTLYRLYDGRYALIEVYFNEHFCTCGCV